MPGPIFVSRLARLPLVDSDGHGIGRVEDVVLVPSGADPPASSAWSRRSSGAGSSSTRPASGEIDPTGVRLRSGTIDVRPFRQRAGEKLAVSDLHGTKVGDEYIVDTAIEESTRTGFWFVVAVALGGRGPLRRRSSHVVEWGDVASPVRRRSRVRRGRRAAQHAPGRRWPSASAALPHDKRRRLAELMEDDRLADLLEELPEDEQIRLIGELDLERAAHVLEEMEPDDAADLLGEMPEAERQRLLDGHGAGGVRRRCAASSPTTRTPSAA